MSVPDPETPAVSDVDPSHTAPIDSDSHVSENVAVDVDSAPTDENEPEVSEKQGVIHAADEVETDTENEKTEREPQTEVAPVDKEALPELGKDVAADLAPKDTADGSDPIKEPTQEPSHITAESLPALDAETVSPTEIKPKKKRLTLQERLALAARAKKKLQAKQPETETKESAETPTSTPVSETVERVTEEIQNLKETQTLEKTQTLKESQDAPAPLEIQQLQARIAELLEENNALKQNQSRPQTDPSEWKRIIAAKDTTIQQLMDEGQALSKKELKLNERVRSLVQENTALESSLKSYATKNEEVLLKLQEVEDVMRTHKLKSVEQLLEHLDDTRRKLAEAQATIQKEKSANWEGKYKELQALYEKELNLKKDTMKKLSDSILQVQMLENESALALKSKEELIELLNQQIIMVKDESSHEISRLEGKIENLRLENENFLKMSQGDRTSSPESNAASHKQIDYAEYSRLSSSHRDLQSQYVSSQENWKTIESNLQSKILTMASSLETFKKAKSKTTQEIRKLSSQLLEQTETISSLESALAQAKSDNDELSLQLKIKKGEYAELEEKLEELRTVFNSDRSNYDLKIQSLTETIEKYEEEQESVLAFQSTSTDNFNGIHSRRMGDSGLHINMAGHPSIGRLYSYNSVSLMNTPAQNWDERGDFSEINDSRHLDIRMSSTSIPGDFQAFDGPEDPNYSDHTNTGTPTIPSFTNGTNNIQLINKMSSSIRRLEMELLSIKEENEELLHQKNEAQQEIAGKFELNSRVEELEKSVATLTEKLKEKTKNEGTLLEVIGEKSERVAELMADVDDLKDLCRQQVQQMIEMAEKSV